MLEGRNDVGGQDLMFEHFKDVEVLAFSNPTPERIVLNTEHAIMTLTPLLKNNALDKEPDNTASRFAVLCFTINSNY